MDALTDKKAEKLLICMGEFVKTADPCADSAACVDETDVDCRAPASCNRELARCLSLREKVV